MAQTPSDAGTGTGAGAGAGSGSSGNTTLARGKACLRCRKRKMRCDGSKPSCAQCARAHKPDACQYDDGRGKTRTQALRERIQRLEEEIALLRDPEYAAPAIVLHDPHAQAPLQVGQVGRQVQMGGGMVGMNNGVGVGVGMGVGNYFGHGLNDSSSSSESPAGSPSSGAGGLSAATSPYSSFDSFNSPQTLFAPLRTLSPAVPLPMDDLDLSQSLLDIFLPHRHQLGLALHPDRLRASLHLTFSPTSASLSHSQSHSRSHSYTHSVGGSPSPGCPSPANRQQQQFGVGNSGFGGGSSPVPGAQNPPQFINVNVGVPVSANGCVTSAPQQSPMLGSQAQGQPQQQLSNQWTPQPRHPALWNAIFLWACFLSRPGPLAQHEGAFLSRTLSSLSDALSIGSSLTSPSPPASISISTIISSPSPSSISPATATVDAIQASVLLARYYYVTGALRAAAYHASAAARLAVDAGLHQLGSVRVAAIAQARAQAQAQVQLQQSTQMQMPWSTGSGGLVDESALGLDATSDPIEMGERVGIWWEAYALDRVLSVAMTKTPCVMDDDAAGTRIDAPWPEDIEEYENVNVDSIRGDSTLRMFFAHQGHQPAGVPGGFSHLALRAKAAALWELAEKVSANWGLSAQSYLPNPATLETCITRFLSTLMPAHQISAAVPDDRRAHVVTHTIALTALVQLHMRFAREGETTSLEKCVRAAHAATGLIKCIAEPDYEFLDPVVGACWTTIASVYSLEQQLRAVTTGTWSPQESSRSQNDLDLIVFALTRLSTRFPITSVQLTRVFELLGIS